MTMRLTTRETFIMFLLLVGLAITGLSGYKLPKNRTVYFLVAAHVFVYLALFFVVFLPERMVENFFFEVSPTRKKCLMDQVSRKNFGKKMPCACCQKGTTGGIPPNYAQWLDTSDSDTPGWFRPDHVDYVNTFSNGQECRSFKQPVYVEHV